MIWLTQQTFDRLQAELEDRRGPRPRRDRRADQRRPRRGRPQGERRLPRRQGRAGHQRGPDPSARGACSRTPTTEPAADDQTRRAPARSSPTASPATTTRSRSCSAPARSPRTTTTSRSTPRSRRSAPPCSATRPARRSTSSSPTAGPRRSRSSARFPSRLTDPASRSDRREQRRQRACSRSRRHPLFEDPVAALAESRQHQLGVGLAAGLELQVHLDLVERQVGVDPGVRPPRSRWRPASPSSASSVARPPGRSGMRSRRLR